MNKLNNKGQSLVLFLIFIPFILLIGVYAIDFNYSKYSLNNIDNINKMVIKYGLKNINSEPEDDMKLLIEKNIKDSEYVIDIDDINSSITVEIKTKVKGVLGFIDDKNIYDIKSKYKGIIEDKKIKLERVD